MTARTAATITASPRDPDVIAATMTRVLTGSATVEDLAILVHQYGGTDVLATIKLWANSYGAPDVRRLVTDYGHTLAKYWATMC